MKVPALAAMWGILIGTVSTPVMAEGDITKGESAARETCAICHNVSPNGQFKQSPPSFTAIAVYRSDNQIRIGIFYPDVHSGMRRQLGFVMDADVVEDLVAYIRSLEIPIPQKAE